MKATKLILIAFALISSLVLDGQTLVQQPVAQMYSTSVMASAGSQLPQAALTGVTTTYSYSESNNSPFSPQNGPRRVTSSGFEDESDPDVPVNPMPIGDGTGILLFFAMLYVLAKALRGRLRVKN